MMTSVVYKLTNKYNQYKQFFSRHFFLGLKLLKHLIKTLRNSKIKHEYQPMIPNISETLILMEIPVLTRMGQMFRKFTLKVSL